MNRTLKIVLITLGSLLSVVTLGLCVILWLVFSPKRLTPIVKEQAEKYLTCQTNLSSVDLTFFSTFPQFGLRLHDFSLVNPKEGAPSDTLVSVRQCVAVVDVMAYLCHNDIIVQKFLLSDGQANLYVAPDSTTNYIVWQVEPTDTTETSTSLDLKQLSLSGIELTNVSVAYWDDLQHARIGLSDASATLSANQDLQSWTSGQYDLDCRMSAISFATSDSASLKIGADGLNLQAKLLLKDGQFSSEGATFSLDSVVYADSAMSMALHNLTLCVDELSGDTTGLQAKVESSFSDFQFDSDGESPIVLCIDGGSLNFPIVRADTGYSAQVDVQLDAVSVCLGKDVYADKLPLEVAANVKSDKSFQLFDVEKLRLQVADQEVTADAQVSMVDTAQIQVTTTFALQPTSLEQLMCLIPSVVVKQLPSMKLAGNVKSLVGQVALAVLSNGIEYRVCKLNSTLEQLDFSMNDSLSIRSSSLNLKAVYPREDVAPGSGKESLVRTDLKVQDLDFVLRDSADLKAQIFGLEGKALISDKIFEFGDVIPSVIADCRVQSFVADYDTIHIDSKESAIRLTLDEALRRHKKKYMASFSNKKMLLNMGQAVKLETGALSMKADATYDKKQSDLLLQYDPRVDLNAKLLTLQIAGVPYLVEIPNLSFDFNLGNFAIRESHVYMGHSDFSLKGDVYNIRKFLDHSGLLTARLNFQSNYTNVDELMDIVNGFGTTDSTQVAAVDTTQTEGNPFIVPKRVDLVLNTQINNTIVGNNVFTDLGGKVTIDDGVLVLEEMGFSSKAARMQLTALYKSEMKNHLFVGANFHLLDVEINELIHLVPDVDTIVPMLKAFDGKAEFHFAAETNLDSHYNIKMSTLKATAAIEGKDLVVMDNETFSTISKYLMFNKKTRNVVDSLSVEMAVARRKATVYPFLISMDKYKAVISGNHTLTNNMGFNYHISLTDCPLPVRLGLDITGDMENLDYKLVKCKYANLYKPEKRNAVQTQTLELKSLISTTLKRTVREQEPAGVKETPVLIQENP